MSVKLDPKHQPVQTPVNNCYLDPKVKLNFLGRWVACIGEGNLMVSRSSSTYCQEKWDDWGHASGKTQEVFITACQDVVDFVKKYAEYDRGI